MPARSRILQKSAPAHARRSAGFSLTEMLVTLSIVAFASAMIFGTARPADPLKAEGDRLETLLQQLRDRARITGAPAALILESGEYSGAVWQGGEWVALPRTARALPSGIALASSAPSPRDGSLVTEPDLRPQIIFDPLGHSTLVPVTLRSESRDLAIELPGGGRS